ncbi:MAG: alpha/beta hydrolase [Bacteroidia bacterium]|nr:alpha/beta hydrolase [Bacteroidia bacterium]
MPPVENSGVRINYSVTGDGPVAVVLVHGWNIDKSYWDEHVPALSVKFKVVTLDLGGHGASGKNRSTWKLKDYAADVIAVINGLALDNVILVGHSMGGNIILEVANAIPDKVIGFVGVDNFKNVGTVYTDADKESIQNYFKEFHAAYDATAESYARQLLFTAESDSAAVERVVKDFRAADSVIALATLEALILGDEQVESTALDKLNVPVYLINSDYTPTQQDSLRAHVKGGVEVRSISGTGHYPMIEKPGVFIAILENVLDNIVAKDSIDQ